MTTEYTVTYFNARGKAEPARFILAYGNANWKDNRIPLAAVGKSPIPDEIKARLRYGQVPLLEFDGKRLVQSHAIFRYLAQQFKLTGNDEFEAAQCDEIIDAVKDVQQLFITAYVDKDETRKAEGLKAAEVAANTRFFPKFNEILENNGGYLVGNSLTWADIVMTCFFENLKQGVGVTVGNEFPALVKLPETVRNVPGIKEYVAQRPETSF